MKPSCFLKAYPVQEKDQRYLLFSQSRSALIRISAACYDRLKSNALTPAETEALTRLGMLVENPDQERQALLGLFDRINAKSKSLDLMVVLNLDCNFDCIYCYEGTMKGRYYMSRHTADQLVDFIRAHFNPGKTDLCIDFYGGEPLLSIARIKQIARAAGDFIRSRGARFKFTLVTNGSLLTRKVAEELVPLGLDSVKITLDGPAELHDHSRPFKTGGGSFEHIISNIQETWDLVKIAIGGNYERHTYQKFPKLLDYLGGVGLTPERITAIKFDPVIKQADTEFILPDYKGGCVHLDEPWLIEAEAFLREEILKRGYRTLKVRMVTCMIDLNDSYVVHFDGKVYKCPGFIGQKGFEVGSLEKGLCDYATTYRVGYWKNEKCADCGYLPLCFGGCRYLSFVRDGQIGALDCRKAYLDTALERLVKQDARYASILSQ